MYDVTYYDGKVSILIWIFLAGLKCIIEDENEGTINLIIIRNAVNMKKALITGITGQDGSYLAEFLLKRVMKSMG